MPAPNADTLRNARTHLNAHTENEIGLCAGCLLWWDRATPFPCTQVAWARKVERSVLDAQPSGTAA